MVADRIQDERFIKCIDDNFLIPITEPKRECTILNLLITSDEQLFGNAKIEPNLGISDHQTLTFDLTFTANIEVYAEIEWVQLFSRKL